MRRSVLVLAALVLLAPASRAAAPFDPAFVIAAPLACPQMASPLALQSATVGGFGDKAARKDKAKKPRVERPAEAGIALGPERARILLRSLTVPGWGQTTLGARKSGAAFLVAEAGIWGAFTAFRIQQAMRTGSYLKTAQLFAGVDLHGRDDEFLRIVGSFASSDEYNLLVVSRDAANLYLSDPDNPDLVGYRDYIARNSISGANAWAWSDEGAFLSYGAQRKNAQRASLRANTALGLAIANRIVSALHAARLAGKAQATTESHSWRFEIEPGATDPTSFRAGLRARF